MKPNIGFQIECNGKDNSTYGIVFFKLQNGNVGIEIRHKGNMIACSTEGERAEDLFNLLMCLNIK